MMNRTTTINTPTAILRNIYGYTAFRGEQQAIIDCVIAGRSAFVLMPTGGGKSLCYQIPALCRSGCAVVISPLIALMENQVMALNEIGVNARAINSSASSEQNAQTFALMKNAKLDLLYVSPERLLMDDFFEYLAQCNIALFAIDEAHCVSQWGHDFRPEYQQLSRLAEAFPSVPRIALTATADAATRDDIIKQLRLTDAQCFISGFDRPNIRYSISDANNPRQQLLSFIREQHAGDSGIVYCLSRKKTEEVTQFLRTEGFDAYSYHAGMSSQQRSKHQQIFLKKENIIMVATIAFGMGIDKPNVRFVAHLSIPKNIESYYQETGRAGRDGLPANAWMTYTTQDIALLRNFIETSEAPERQKRIEHGKLNALLGLCETSSCRRQVLLAYFGDHSEPCQNCDTCLAPPDSFDGTEAAQKALSCVYRTGQRFGAAYIIDVLLGREHERIQRFQHDRISTFAIGTEFNKTQWQSIMRQLVARDLLRVDVINHGGLYISKAGLTFLKQKDSIKLRHIKKSIPAAKAAKTKSASITHAALSDIEKQLFESLRQKRLEMAQQQGIPPYIIFHDSTLLEMTKQRPQSLEALLQINGVGQTKLDRYGETFLQLMKDATA